MAAPSRPLNKRHDTLIQEALKQQNTIYTEEQQAHVDYKAALKNRDKDIGTFRDARHKLKRAEAASNKYSSALIDSIKTNAAAFEGIYDTWEDLIKANRRFEANMKQAGGDLRRSQRKNSQQGFQRQMMLQAGAQGVNAIAELSTVNRLPVIGGAIQSGVGTAVNAGLMGAGATTAAAMGGLAFLGAGIAGGVANAYNQFESEEALERQLGQRMGVGAGRGFIRDMRKQGLTREQIGGLGSGLSQTVGSTSEAVGVYQMQTAFGINPMGAMGAMASTGQGSQLRMVQNAISVGMAQGLARGRFGEMVDGLQHLVRQQGIGVGVGGEELGGTLSYMGALGSRMGIKGSQFMGVMGQLDASARGKTGGLSESISFLSAYNYLQAGGRGALEGLGSSGSGGRVTPFDVQEMMERGSTGKGGMGRIQITNMLEQYRRIAGTSAADMEMSARRAKTPEEQAQIDAAKGRYQMMQQGLVTGGAAANLTVARQLTDAFLTTGNISDKDIKTAQDAGKSQQEKSFDEIHEQTGLQQRIAYGIEALGRSMPGTGGTFNRTFEGLLAGLNGEAATRFITPGERAAGYFNNDDSSYGEARFSEGRVKLYQEAQARRRAEFKKQGWDYWEDPSDFNLVYEPSKEGRALQDFNKNGVTEDFKSLLSTFTETITNDPAVSEEMKAAAQAAQGMLLREIADPATELRNFKGMGGGVVPLKDSAGGQFTPEQLANIANVGGGLADVFVGGVGSRSIEDLRALTSQLARGELSLPSIQRSEDVIQFYVKRLQELQPLPGQATR
jgi:hypothetical protein